MVKVWGRSSNGKTGKQAAKKMARVSFCDVSGATSPSCTVTRAFRNVHDQPDLIRRRPAVQSVLCPVEFKTICSPESLTPGTSEVKPAASSSLEIFMAILSRLFDRIAVLNFWPLTFTFELFKKGLLDQRLWFWSAVFCTISLFFTMADHDLVFCRCRNEGSHSSGILCCLVLSGKVYIFCTLYSDLDCGWHRWVCPFRHSISSSHASEWHHDWSECSLFLHPSTPTTLAKKIETATDAKLQARACSREHAPVPEGTQFSQFFFFARAIPVTHTILSVPQLWYYPGQKKEPCCWCINENLVISRNYGARFTCGTASKRDLRLLWLHASMHHGEIGM